MRSERVRKADGLALPLALLVVLQAPLSAAVITVGPGCTLVQAIDAANGDSVVGSCTQGSGVDTIELTGNVDLTAVHNTTDGPNGFPSITSEMTIDGAGHQIDHPYSEPVVFFRIFHIGSEGNLTLKNSSVSGGLATEAGGGGFFNRGHLTLEEVTIPTNAAYGPGGAIHNLGTTVLRNSSVTGVRTQGETIVRGGAIFNGPSATLVVENSFLANNRADAVGPGDTWALGGGIYASAGSMTTLANSTVAANLAVGVSQGTGGVAHGYGGGIYSKGTLEVSGSTFKSNSAYAVHEGSGTTSAFAAGGAIDSSGFGSALTLTNSTVTLNRAYADADQVDLRGGGVSAFGSGTAELAHVTLSENGLGYSGGGTSVAVYGQTISGTALTVRGSIVTGSESNACDGPITGTGNFGSGCVSGWSDVTGLMALSDTNGGPTETHALDPGSNAVNAAGACGLATDQRGISRRDGCDSGAYEVNKCDPDGSDDDIHEVEGNGGNDACYGGSLTLGATQSHLHCDEDWVWFTPVAGRTYEIKTLNLTNGADTVLDIARSCGLTFSSDDNGGLGAASKIFYTAFDTTLVDIRVTEAHDSYNPGTGPPATVEGYDVVATCVEHCGCSPPDLTLMNDAVAVTATYEACQTLTAGQFAVEAPADVSFRAGDKVVFNNGVTVEGDLAVEIDPSLQP